MSSKTIGYLLIGVFVFILNSCAPTQQINEQLLNLQLQMTDVQNNYKDMDLKVNRVNNRLFLVREKVSINAEDIKELRSVALITTPREELEVIKVTNDKKKDRGIPVSEGPLKKGVSKTKPKHGTGKGIVKKDAKKKKAVKTIVKKDTKKKKVMKKAKNKPEDVYRDAYLLFDKGRLSDAFETFSAFLERFPEHPLADNAQYWIGEIYYSQKDFSRALTEFSKVVDKYPEENKVPDAFLKMAFSYSELGDRDAYIESLERLVELYPASEAAMRAMDRLQYIQHVE